MSRAARQSLVSTTAVLTTLASLTGLAGLPAYAGPNGGTVVGGSATIQGQGSASVGINQSSQNTIINWQTFNIYRGETTTFNQPNASAIALNRVIGGQGPSFLDGTLTANGRVFIINGDGILFGPHSSITTAGFLATTNDIRDADFMTGNFNLLHHGGFGIPGRPNASIVNLGNITATNGGFAALVAPGVRNSGTITATLGTVTLAAGNTFTLDFYGDRLITLAVNDQVANQVIDVATGRPLRSLVSNRGTLSADGGRVELTAAAARAVVNWVINNKGLIEANSVGARNGMIVLSAATRASKPAGAPTQTIKLSGTISAAGTAKGTKGGTVVVSGENIVLKGATIDASGDAGGGKVLIGGDVGGGHPTAAASELAKLASFVVPTATTVSVDSASTMNASATGSGAGGKVVIWSNDHTKVAGTILAQSGAAGGNGGFVETSGHIVEFAGIRVSTSAPRGTSGTWLIDPTNLTIDATAAATIAGNLTSTNVLVQTNADGTTSGPGATSPGPGDILVDADIIWSGNNTLTLSAYRNVQVDEVTIRNNGGGNLILRADNTGNGHGTVLIFGGFVDFTNSTGAVSIYYNPSCECNKYANPNDYSGSVSGNLTAYMLVNNAADLRLVGTSAVEGSITGNFALGKNIDATGFTGFQAVGTSFGGLFDGNGGLGINYTISNLNLTIPSNNGLGNSFGLFPFLTGTVRNLNLANVNIIGNDNNYFLGAVAGDSQGTISNVHVLSGSVNGLSFQGVVAGGLVGQNEAGASITGSSANVNVTVSDTTDQTRLNVAGGLFGANFGQVFQSYASGAVRAAARNWAGGLGGRNLGSLRQVFALGPVTGGDGSSVGGLVAVNSAQAGEGEPGLIVDTYAIGSVSGGANSTVAGLVAVNNTGAAIKTSYSAGAISGGAGSTTGGLVARSNGTVTNSYWDTQTSGQPTSAGGTGMTTRQLVAGLPPGFDPNVWTILPDPSYPYFPWQPTSTIPTVVLPPNNPTNPNPPPQQQIIDNLTGGLTLVSLPPPVNVLPYPPFPQLAPPVPGPGPAPQVGGLPRLFAVPPPGETRYVKDEVLLMVDCDTPQSALDAVARDMHLTILAQQCLTQTHLNLLRMHIDNGLSVAEVIRGFARSRYRIIAVAQANFIYVVAQDLAQDPDLAGRTQEGDSAQYALSKLGLIDIHRLIKGANVSIAVIDSQIDVRHPDLDGVFAEQYDAVGQAEAPHPHGTGMAGAIAAHQRLMGIAPAARIFAVHAFSSNAASADSTTFAILKGLDWASSKGVRVINMSFAGPRDPSLERALKLAHDKGIVLIAAAGNAGPKSPPLFPGADPNVIAVTATDANDKVFNGANRGKYIAVAAPGVDILVPAPGGYQLTTGTSVSSAEVAGVAALLLERNPNLGPEDIRKLLTMSAKHPGDKPRDDDYGSGLVDPARAIRDAGEITAVGQPARR
jgi:filamentous hemagglutinin family protein